MLKSLVTQVIYEYRQQLELRFEELNAEADALDSQE